MTEYFVVRQIPVNTLNINERGEESREILMYMMRISSLARYERWRELIGEHAIPLSSLFLVVSHSDETLMTTQISY